MLCWAGNRSSAIRQGLAFFEGSVDSWAERGSSGDQRTHTGVSYPTRNGAREPRPVIEWVGDGGRNPPPVDWVHIIATACRRG